MNLGAMRKSMGAGLQALAFGAGLLTMAAAPALAQVAVEVTVIDARTGRPAAGVPVIVSNPQTGARFEARSDAQGRARFGGLSAGDGWIVSTPETAQYAPLASEALSLRSFADRGVSLALQPNAALASGEIVVTAQARSRLNTTNAEVSGTLTREEISRIPVEARSLERVLFRLPGVTQSTGFFGEAPAVAINGANALFTNYTIDGLDNNENFLGGQKFPVPVGAIQDVTVLSSNYSVEYGRTANGVVNVTTKAGSNEYGGEAFFVTRPGGFGSAELDVGGLTTLFGAPVSETFSRFQGGFAVGGPIVRDQTFFFLNAEFTRDSVDNLLSSPLLAEPEVITGSNRQTLLTARLDHAWSAQLNSTLRVNHGRVKLEQPGGGLEGGTTFPSAGLTQDRFSTNAAFTTTYRGAGWDYTASVQYSRFDWDFGEPLVPPGPQVSVNGPAFSIGTIGSPGFIFDSTENTAQFQQRATFSLGRHTLKVGTDFLNARFRLFGGGNVFGNFAVDLTEAQVAAVAASGVGAGLTVADLPLDATVTNAIFETQPASFGASQRIYTAYAEDQFQATPELSLTLGLRYDFDSLSNIVGNGDFNNIAPRAALNWSPRPDIALKAGIGLFHEKLPYAIISDAIQQNSDAPAFLAQLQSLIDQGLLPAGTDLGAVTTGAGNIAVSSPCATLGACLAIDPASLDRDSVGFEGDRRIFNPFGLDNPTALQASLGVEWQPAPNWLLGIDGQFSRSRNLARLVDLNSPEPFVFAGVPRTVEEANLTRPALANPPAVSPGEARSIVVSDTGGRARYQALIFKIQKQKGQDPYDLNIFYTLSRLENDTDDINARANDANNFALDFGPSLNDRTHVISSIFNLYPFERLTLTLAGLFQSGQPINFVPDAGLFGTTDLNGDGLSFADQFTGNPDRAPGFTRNSGRLPWAMTVDVGAGYRFQPPGAPGEVELRADFFNVFNTRNESGFPVNFTASNQVQVAGQPFQLNSIAPPRTLQLSVRYLF